MAQNALSVVHSDPQTISTKFGFNIPKLVEMSCGSLYRTESAFCAKIGKKMNICIPIMAESNLEPITAETSSDQ